MSSNKELIKKINDFFFHNEEKKFHTKEAGTLGDSIKATMGELKLETIDTKECTAKRTVALKMGFNEPLLMEALKERELEEEVIKQKEYIDFEALEREAMADEDFAKWLSKFQTSSETVTLRVSALKKGKKK